MTDTRGNEAEFQSQVIELARICGWKVLHIRKSIGKGRRWVTTTSIVGWVDLMLMRPPDGLVFAELKVPPHTTTPEQDEVIEFLSGFPFAKVCVWTPEDWPDIEATLTRRKT